MVYLKRSTQALLSLEENEPMWDQLLELRPGHRGVEPRDGRSLAFGQRL